MFLKLIRKEFTADSTVGELYVNDIFQCYTLEDVIRDGNIFEVKVQDKTAIPEGMYAVVIDFSNRFQREMPHVLDVLNFTGIRIHAGNDSEDTSGCILVGETKGVNFVGNSRKAFDKFLPKLMAASHDGEKIVIEIKREPPILPA